MASSLVGRLGAFFVGFGVASVVGAKVIHDELQRSLLEVLGVTRGLAARVSALEAKQK